jgi:hypothetical protein
MHKPFTVLLTSVFALAIAAGAQAQSIPARVSALEATVESLQAQIYALQQEPTYIAAVDCGAGGSIMDILNDTHAKTAVSVYIVVTGTCLENVDISRDHVEIVGGAPDATIEGAGGPTVFVTGQDTRLNNLTISGAESVRVRHGHLEGGGLHLIGGVVATMGSAVRLYGPTIDSATEFGVDISEESFLAAYNCTISGSGFDGVRVLESTFVASECTISNSGWAGVRVEQGSNVRFDTTTITSNHDGVVIGDSSIIRHVAGALSITANTSAGIRCAAAPAVPQLVNIAASSVTANPGGNFVNCAGH